MANSTSRPGPASFSSSCMHCVSILQSSLSCPSEQGTSHHPNPYDTYLQDTDPLHILNN
jgi:hypothetical protein